MTATLTEASFIQQLNTKFRVLVDAPRPIELELVEVKGWRGQAEEQRGMERFSVFFKGPGDILMPQHTYTLEHEQLGTFDIFLVPTTPDESGFRYEAVFNYFK
ncbi:MAG: hypothetical protein DMF64_17670 [Acidobacteria bacterium]|nr:MAG: hypothetical protein DMF64_17670 [Acidobacteriota bacterium]